MSRIAGIFAITLVLGSSACQLNDPTESTVNLRVQNDLSIGVRVGPCRDAHCRGRTFEYSTLVKAGDYATVNVAAGAGSVNPLLVRQVGRRDSACLFVVLSGAKRDGRILVSRASACGALRTVTASQ